MDPDTGLSYFYHKESGKSVWERPTTGSEGHAEEHAAKSREEHQQQKPQQAATSGAGNQTGPSGAKCEAQQQPKQQQSAAAKSIFLDGHDGKVISNACAHKL